MENYRFKTNKPKSRSFENAERKQRMRIFAVLLSIIVFAAIGIVFLVFFHPESLDDWSQIYTPPKNNITVQINETKTCNDDCFIKLALSNKNSTYCKNVSENRSDECYIMFSNSEINACLALKNYSLKKDCVIKSKNLSLCELLRNEDVVNCRGETTPICNITEARDSCLAFYYNNSIYCSSEECRFNYAKERNDSFICENFSLDAEKYACRSVAKKTNECSLLNSIVVSDYCYQLLAQYSKDFSYCNYIVTGRYKYGCYSNAAVEKKDHSYCKKNEIEYIWDCYRNYSLATTDINGCFEIDSKYAKGSRDGCLRIFARAFELPYACNYLSDIYSRTNCYADVILQATNLSMEKCEAIVHETWKDKCYGQYAFQSNQGGACNYIQNEYEKTKCKEKFGK